MALFDYLLVGFIFYAIVALLRRNSFKDADITAIIRGVLFGVVLWPIALLWILYGPKKDEDSES